jgi:hypothetical protein
MSLSLELADLFRRDLSRLLQELDAFPDSASLWRTLPGIANSAGNLILHLEGNLREYICRCIAGIPYQRHRDAEFSNTGLTIDDLRPRVQYLIDQVPSAIAALTPDALAAIQPEPISNKQMSTGQYLLHLYGHFSYHLGQIDYLRRVSTAGSAVSFAQLA